MPISALRQEVTQRAVEFAWDQWGQMGMFGETRAADRRAADPEALLLFTLEIARDDPRLFDEVLDWLWVNERLVSVQRLRNLAAGDDDDRALVHATIAWLGQRKPRARLSVRQEGEIADPKPLFRRMRTPIRRPDPAFLAHGFLKPEGEARGNARPPDRNRPINFAFRMRDLLGVGARAEVVRVLLGTDAPRMTSQAISLSAGYSKRNVHDALTALTSAGAIDAAVISVEQRYRAPRAEWAALLGMSADELPRHYEWPALFAALRRVVRWLNDPATAALSDYLRASEARTLIREIEPSLRVAGVPVTDRGLTGVDYWEDAAATIRAALAPLN